MKSLNSPKSPNSPEHPAIVVPIPEHLADILDQLGEVFTSEVGGSAFTHQEILARIIIEAGARYLNRDGFLNTSAAGEVPEVSHE